MKKKNSALVPVFPVQIQQLETETLPPLLHRFNCTRRLSLSICLLFPIRVLLSFPQVIYFNWLIFYFTLWVTKGAILSVYHQIVPKDSRAYWITLHGLGLLMVIALVTALLLNLIWCRPIRLNWSLDEEELCFAPFDLTIVVSTGLMQVAVDIAS